MYFLLDACQQPGILRTLYFGILFKDIFFSIIPIALVLMLMIDFTKAIIAGDDEKAKKSANLVPKRIMYAIIIFSIPWVITILMKTLDGLGLKVANNYNTCIENAKSAAGNFEYYDELLSAEEDAELEEILAEREKNKSSTGNQGSSSTDYISSNVSTLNVLQCGQKWSSHPLCTNKSRIGSGGDNRTICSSGCGFSALTTVLRTFGYTSLEPNEVVDEVCGLKAGIYGHAAPSDFTAIANKYGLHSKVWSQITSKKTASDTFTPLVKEGKRLIINMPGHYISVLGIDSSGNLIVGDSSRGYNTGGKRGGPYTMETLFSATITSKSPYWLNVTAIWK